MNPECPNCGSHDTVRIGSEQIQCETCGEIFIVHELEEAA
jgi:ribosomal protein L37AE/L43A